jgi:uncharacterized protein YqjF (DUF2071 family)
MSDRPPFLTARWENLLLLNYACPKGLLEPLVPAGTTLELWRDRALVSLVGFLFADTRVRRCRIPGHETFEEVNLRFYVTRATAGGETRRGVVFIRELVPRAAVAVVARRLYGEPYWAVPMAHRAELSLSRGGRVEYSWQHRHTAFVMTGTSVGPAEPCVPGSEAAFVTDHTWGYSRQRDGQTLEYEVQHPPWPIWHAIDARFDGRPTALYGEGFAAVLTGPSQSAFMAMGSKVSVYAGRRL